MKTIWKFPLRIDESQRIEMPKEASIITVQIQNHKPCLWAVVDIDDGRVETVMRTFEIYGTGHSIRAEPGFERYYVATFQQPPFVWHLFERFEVNEDFIALDAKGWRTGANKMEETPRRTFPDVINQWTDELLRLNKDATLEQVGLILQLGTLGQRLIFEANAIGQNEVLRLMRKD
jgi:hypothetical protein